MEIARLEFRAPSFSTLNHIALSDDDTLLAIAARETIHIYTVERSGDKVHLQQKQALHSPYQGDQVTFVEFQPGNGGSLVSSWTRQAECPLEFNVDIIRVWGSDMNDDVFEETAASKSLTQPNSLSDVVVKNGSISQEGFAKRHAFSHDGSSLLIFSKGYPSEIIAVVATNDLREQFQLVGHSDAIVWAEFSPDDRLIATASWDTTIRIWDAANGNPIQILTGKHGQLWEASFSPDGKLIAAGTGDRQIRIWNIESGKLLHTLQGYKGWIRSLCFSPDGKMLAAGGTGILRVFDVMTGECIQHWQAAGMEFPLGPEVTNVQYTGQGLLVFEYDGRQFMFDAGTNQKGQFENGKNQRGFTRGVNNCILSSDGSLLFTTDSDRSVRVWKL